MFPDLTEKYNVKLLNNKTMKQFIFMAVMTLLTVCANAQVTVSEPEFVGQIKMLTSDSTGVLLEKEKASLKTKSSHFGMLPIPGASLLDKTKTCMTIQGASAKNTVGVGTVRFLIRVERTDIDPSTFLRVIKFDVKKKTRESKVSEVGLFQGFSMDLNSSSAYDVQKYGDSSLLITLKNVQPGQYGISTTMWMDASTFAVN